MAVTMPTRRGMSTSTPLAEDNAPGVSISVDLSPTAEEGPHGSADGCSRADE